jgi:hypothetical protein
LALRICDCSFGKVGGYEKENHSLNGFHNALKEIIKELHVSSTLLLHGIRELSREKTKDFTVPSSH